MIFGCVGNIAGFSEQHVEQIGWTLVLIDPHVGLHFVAELFHALAELVQRGGTHIGGKPRLERFPVSEHLLRHSEVATLLEYGDERLMQAFFDIEVARPGKTASRLAKKALAQRKEEIAKPLAMREQLLDRDGSPEVHCCKSINDALS